MSEDDTLDTIGLKHKTDKSSRAHDYLSFYENFFSPLRKEKLTLLEFGVWTGGSLRTWEEYFPYAKIVGADINPASKRFERDRIHIEVVDQANVEEVTQLAVKHGPFDIVIEDGSHMWEHQITSLRTAFPFLCNNGYYIVEDLQTNYGALKDTYKGVSSYSCVEYLKSWLDLRVGDEDIPIAEVEDAFLRTYGRSIEFISFYRHACIIRKRFTPTVRIPVFGQPIVYIPAVPSTVGVRVTAHVSHRGDVTGFTGYVNLASDIHAFQGVSLDAGEDVLEYRVRWLDGSWSEWAPTGSFVGTRGQAKLLNGVTIRLRDDAKKLYDLRTIGRFVGLATPIDVPDGEDCASETGNVLCGLQVELTRLSVSA